MPGPGSAGSTPGPFTNRWEITGLGYESTEAADASRNLACMPSLTPPLSTLPWIYFLPPLAFANDYLFLFLTHSSPPPTPRALCSKRFRTPPHHPPEPIYYFIFNMFAISLPPIPIIPSRRSNELSLLPYPSFFRLTPCCHLDLQSSQASQESSPR